MPDTHTHHTHTMQHSRKRDDDTAGEITEKSEVVFDHDHDGGDKPHHHAKPDTPVKREPDKSIWWGDKK